MAWERETEKQELWMMLHVPKPQVGNCLAEVRKYGCASHAQTRFFKRREYSDVKAST